MNTERLTQLEEQWREALDKENAVKIGQIVREVLKNFPNSTLACEIRYRRGILQLTEGEGLGSVRLAKALAEFEIGLKAAEELGEKAEPWRTLLHTQVAACLARKNNLQAAIDHLKKAAQLKPKTAAGIGALLLLQQLLEENGKKTEAKKVQNQRLSYARALVQENPNHPELPFFKFLLTKELLDSPFKKQGLQLLEELKQLPPESIPEDLREEIQQLSQNTL